MLSCPSPGNVVKTVVIRRELSYVRKEQFASVFTAATRRGEAEKTENSVPTAGANFTGRNGWDTYEL